MKKWQKILILCVSCVCLLATMIIPTFASEIVTTTRGNYEINPDNLKVAPARFTSKMTWYSDTSHYGFAFGLPYSSSNIPGEYYINCKSTDWLNIHFSDSENSLSRWDIGMVRLAYANHTQQFTVKKNNGDVIFTVDVQVPKQSNNVFSGELSISVEFPGYYSKPYNDFYITVDVYPSYSAYASYVNQMVDVSSDYKELADNYRSEISNLNSQISDLNNSIGDLNSIISTQNDDYNSLERRYEAALNEWKKTREVVENNNALFMLGDGIGSAFSSIIGTLSSLSVGGVTLGAVISLLVVGFIIFLIIKLVRGN